jgi:arabinose-5-phosphate isomerase
MLNPNKEKLLSLAKIVISTEIAAITNLLHSINDDFFAACKLLLACEGRIIVTGIGKSGHIGNKIAATFASTGSPAFFLHPSEASHGDIGVITTKDVVIALSNSGTTNELLAILPTIKLLNVPLISITGYPDSTLAKNATVNLNINAPKEACPLGLVPTSSTTATLVMGDALAVALFEARGFTIEDFARSHPGGSLGKRLLLRVDDIMRTGQAIPKVAKTALLSEALVEISQKRLGMTTIVDEQRKLVGVFTDGDLRRAIDKNLDIHTISICDIMTTNCKTIVAGTLAFEALQIMEQYKITTLVILSNDNIPIGVIHLHDLLSAGLK